MDQARQQVIDSIKNHSNILVSVSTDPSVDELSAALGLTVMLNNLDKRATSVFSGAIPPAINFLEPEKTFEDSADSLRDFIIALDKNKADHLRYKVEGNVVKIFITPYRTTLSQNDLEFSQGDYNVDLVIALGVNDQGNLDKALEAHGKILHDATVMTITTGDTPSSLGSLDWHNPTASSLCEMVASLADGLKEDQPLLDQQTSTALLTGIVSATDRFSNDRTSSLVMTIAAQLMAAGANQQLIAAKLEEAHDIAPSKAPDNSPKDGGDQMSGAELTIERPDRKPKQSQKPKNAVVTPPTEVKSEPEAEPQVEPAQSQETKDQIELEKQLAEVTGSPTGTMEDIENELKQATEQPQGPVNEAPLPPPKDATMPDFEPTGEPMAPPQPAPSNPTPEPPQAQEPPQIINQHGTVSEAPLNPTPPINSIQGNPNEGEATIDPFNSQPPLNQPEVAPPAASVEGGTAEGAALLAATDSVEPQAPPQATPQAPPFSVPELPPLPPLPTATGVPPPPPPPPPPSLGPPPLDGTMPAGPVSGDVFGDTAAGAPGLVSPEDSPSEPGQFKIPGQ